MPPTPNRQLKFVRDVPFRNTVYHPASNQSFSVPLTSTERSQWTSLDNMPGGIRREIDTVLNGIYGKEVKGLRPDVYRFCWYESMSQPLPFSQSIQGWNHSGQQLVYLSPVSYLSGDLSAL